MRRILALILAIGVLTPPAMANEGFVQIRDKATFVKTVQGRELTRMGIKLDVTSDGRIIGRAFGRPVTGAWKWKSGYFCRDLYWGDRDLGPNCQAVRVQGQTLRFISDQGAGQFADLELR